MTVLGEPITRVDGRAKVTGAAQFAAEFEMPRLAYAVMLTSTIANGRILRMETAAARQAPGVLTVMTPANAPRLPQTAKPVDRVLSLLQDDQVHYNNQPIGVVVAETLNQALYAASLVTVVYQQQPAQLDFEAGFSTAHAAGHGRDGDEVSADQLAAGLAAGEVKVDEIYLTPPQNHNPMEPHATIAQWNGDRLTLHDSTQYISGAQHTVARTLGLADDQVRVLCPYTGGGFGCKGSTWSHVVLAAMAARVVDRPVKLALERPQMFGPVGGRPRTHQHIVLAAKPDGRLTAIQHNVYSHTSVIEDFTERCSNVTRMLYASPIIQTSQRLAPLNLGTPTYQRAPGEATGTFALEIAMDELACKLNLDPIQLRLKNYAENDPTSGKPFSSKNLRQCYAQGAERFGWSKRNPRPRSTKQGHEWIGWGMATATYSANRSAASALVQFEPGGRVTVASGSQDLGTGTYTIMAQVAAATLNLRMELIDVRLGDSTLPRSPVSGGSQTTASLTPAVQAAARQARLKLLTAAAADPGSPLHGAPPEQLDFEHGRIMRKGEPESGESFTALLARNGNHPLGATASAEPEPDAQQYSNHSWGAVFAEVAVDEALGTPRVRRITGVYDVGTLLNEKTGRSQFIGGIVWAVGFALLEASHADPQNGRIVNNNLAEYHLPANADIGEIDVSVVGVPDPAFNSLGARGIGEIGITGTSAAIANAIYHATGKRIRSAPITADLLLD